MSFVGMNQKAGRMRIGVNCIFPVVAVLGMRGSVGL